MSCSPILLDLDGTLADSLPDIAATLNHVRAAFGLDPLPPAAVREMIGDGARVLLRRGLGEVAGEAAVAEAWPMYDAHHREQCTRLVALFPGVRERLESWRQAGHPLAIVTNKPERFAVQMVEHLGLDRYFEVVIGGDTLPQRKPDPAMLHEALRRLGVAGDGGLMVGDGPQDIRSGKAAGLRTAAVLFGYHDEPALRAEGADEYWPVFGVAEG